MEPQLSSSSRITTEVMFDNSPRVVTSFVTKFVIFYRTTSFLAFLTLHYKNIYFEVKKMNFGHQTPMLVM